MKSDKAIGIILILFSVFMYLHARKLPDFMYGTFGAGFFPKILFAMLAVSGVVLTVGQFVKERKAKKQRKVPEKEQFTWAKVSCRFREILKDYSFVIIGFVLFFCYVILLDYLGYTIATLVFMSMLMWILGPRNLKTIPIILIISVGMTFFIYFGFLKLLHVFLPSGKLQF